MTPRKLPSTGTSKSVDERSKKNKSTISKKRKDDAVKAEGEKKRNKSKKKLRKNEDENKDLVQQFVPSPLEDDDGVDNLNVDNSLNGAGVKKRNKSKKKKKVSNDEKNDDFINKSGQLGVIDEDTIDNPNDKSKKVKKKRKTNQHSSKAVESVRKSEVYQGEVFLISSGDEDSSKGMKKWVKEYHQSRPGLEVLQQRIDDFIAAHEAQLEQERKDREAQAAEGGWTVVVHHKGRKKTTDSESGTVVGSVAKAAVEDKLAKKKTKEVGLDFYRFQRREAQRNEIMMLQSKFEQDRKRIQQLRAARKFKPY